MCTVSGDSFVTAGRALNSLLSKIANLLGAVVESKGCYGNIKKSPPVLNVCGSSGTGKIMGIGHCCQEAVTNVESKFEKSPKIVYLNGLHLIALSEKKAMQATLLDAIRISQKLLKCPINGDGHRLSATVLVLDEIDFLVTSKGTKGYLRSICLLASDPNTLLSLICISNSVDNNKSRCLGKLGLVSIHNLLFYILHFCYTHKESIFFFCSHQASRWYFKHTTTWKHLSRLSIPEFHVPWLIQKL
jgi:Cdc6-like AAA superfamily ATPase